MEKPRAENSIQKKEHPECQPGEYFMGNIDPDSPNGKETIENLRKNRTLVRIGQSAFDTDGKIIKDLRPVFGSIEQRENPEKRFYPYS